MCLRSRYSSYGPIFNKFGTYIPFCSRLDNFAGQKPQIILTRFCVDVGGGGRRGSPSNFWGLGPPGVLMQIFPFTFFNFVEQMLSPFVMLWPVWLYIYEENLAQIND